MNCFFHLVTSICTPVLSYNKNNIRQNRVDYTVRVPKQCDRKGCTTRLWEPLFVNATLPSEQRCRLVNFGQNKYPVSVEN